MTFTILVATLTIFMSGCSGANVPPAVNEVMQPEVIIEKTSEKPYSLTEEDMNLPLFARITNIDRDKTPIEADVEFLGDWEDKEAMTEAAIANGDCNKEDTSACLPNGFYLYNTGEKSSYRITSDTRIIISARNSDCEYKMLNGTSDLYMEEAALSDFINLYKNCTLPNVYHLSEEGGEIVSLVEQYIP